MGIGINAGGGVRIGGIRSLNGTAAAAPAQSVDSVNEMSAPAGSGFGVTPGHLAFYWEILGTGLLAVLYYAAPGRR